MAASPRFKVYDSSGMYRAACHEPEAAACLVAFYGLGATIRYGHQKRLWTEGEDGCAGESIDYASKRVQALFDHVAQVVIEKTGG